MFRAGKESMCVCNAAERLIQVFRLAHTPWGDDMAITELYSGTEAVSTTEWSLTTDTSGPDADTTDGVFQIFLDVSAVAAGDLFRVRVYEKVRSSDTQRIVYDAYIGGPQMTPIWTGPSFILMHGWDVTLIKVSGTDRTITWSIRQIA